MSHLPARLLSIPARILSHLQVVTNLWPLLNMNLSGDSPSLRLLAVVQSSPGLEALTFWCFSGNGAVIHQRSGIGMFSALECAAPEMGALIPTFHINHHLVSKTAFSQHGNLDPATTGSVFMCTQEHSQRQQGDVEGYAFSCLGFWFLRGCYVLLIV